MSGGQQQRVALARAIINQPKVLLLDEPLAALDRKLRREMQIELQTLQREVGITFVLVTHDQEEALSMSDRICIMRDGRIVQFGGPRELYDEPVNRYVADFVGKSNFFDGRGARAVRADCACVRPRRAAPLTARAAAADRRRAQAATLSLRPEQIALTRSAPTADGAAVRPSRCINRIFLGDQTEYLVDQPALWRYSGPGPRQAEAGDGGFAPGTRLCHLGGRGGPVLWTMTEQNQQGRLKMTDRNDSYLAPEIHGTSCGATRTARSRAGISWA